MLIKYVKATLTQINFYDYLYGTMMYGTI